MRINEIILESTDLDEGWKDWVAGAAMAGAALGAQGKPHKAPKHATHAKPAVVQKAQVNPNVAGSAIRVDFCLLYVSWTVNNVLEC